MSLYTRIQEAVKNVVAGVSLTHNGTAVPVTRRKLPAVEEVLDTVPLVCVFPGKDPDSLDHFSFRSEVGVYPVTVALVRAADGNLAVDPEAAEWRERVRDAFRGAFLAGAAEVWDKDVTHGPTIDPAAYAKNYDYQTLTISIKATEPAVSA